jgi:hypothetical protein
MTIQSIQKIISHKKHTICVFVLLITPNKVPTPEVKAIANAPQKVNRAVAVNGEALPTLLNATGNDKTSCSNKGLSYTMPGKNP